LGVALRDSVARDTGDPRALALRLTADDPIWEESDELVRA